jgi:hypothetical protein
MLDIKKTIKDKNKIIKVLVFFIAVLILFYIFKRTLFLEHFTNSTINSTTNTIISIWDSGSGFYSELLFKFNHYLYCKKYRINFKTESVDWPYTFKTGWTDYFENISLEYDTHTKMNNKEKSNTRILSGCCTILEQFPLRDYVQIIPEYYRYNKQTKQHIYNMKVKLKLIGKEYGSIYIRRGDKLVDEINFISSTKFTDLLLDKYPECKIIFVQTDDYNSYLDVKRHIQTLGKTDINVITLCPDTSFGAIANSGYLTKMKTNQISTLKENQKTLTNNKEYVDKIKNNLSKPISDMTPHEKYEHTMELLTSVDICINSKYCICDYKSNVSRFIKIAHNNFNHVFDVNNTDSIINLDSKLCPAFDFDSKHQNI